MRVIFYKITRYHMFSPFVPRRIYHEERGAVRRLGRGILYEIKATRER